MQDRRGTAAGWRGAVLLFSVLATALCIGITGCGGVDPKLNRPNLIAASKDGKTLYIFDSRAPRILAVDRDFNLLREITHPDLTNLWGLNTLDNGDIVVTNSRTSQVYFSEEERKKNWVAEVLIFDPQGRLKNRHQWHGDKEVIEDPTQIVFLKDGSFLIDDIRRNYVARFSEAGALLGTFGQYGTAPSFLYAPNDMLIDKSGNIVVIESYNFRASVFDAQGKFLCTFGSKGSGPGELMFPQNCCMDDEGNIYITEMSTMRISVFDPQYRFKMAIEPKKEGVKEKILQLFGVAFLPNPGQIFVCDSVESRILVFDKAGKLVKIHDSVIP